MPCRARWIAVCAALLLLTACDKPAPPKASAASAANVTAVATAVAQCTGCHGPRGEGNAGAGFPRLAGQSSRYLRHQLDSFADGTRVNPVMGSISHAMSPEQRASAAAHFASLASVPPGAAASAPGDVARGRDLAEQGDAPKQVQPCKNCHGPAGAGLGMQLPYLAGQPAAYLAKALAAFRDGSRRTDPTGQMTPIAKVLSDADAQAVAAYYAEQPPPAAPLDVPLAAASAPR
jgi:cytochrome c553